MTGKTHRVGGTLGCLVGFSVMQSKGLLINGVNPLTQLLVMYPFAVYGGVFSDLDHNAHSIPSKDMFSVGVNKLLHLTTPMRKASGKELSFPLSVFDAKHRSWQTHSDLFLISLLILYNSVIHMGYSANTIMLSTVLVGFILGVVSHIVLDMLTTEGIPSVILQLASRLFNVRLPKKLRFVPKLSIFATDTKWEHFIKYLMSVISILLSVRLVYLASPYRLVFNL